MWIWMGSIEVCWTKPFHNILEMDDACITIYNGVPISLQKCACIESTWPRPDPWKLFIIFLNQFCDYQVHPKSENQMRFKCIDSIYCKDHTHLDGRHRSPNKVGNTIYRHSFTLWGNCYSKQVFSIWHSMLMWISIVASMRHSSWYFDTRAGVWREEHLKASPNAFKIICWLVLTFTGGSLSEAINDLVFYRRHIQMTLQHSDVALPCYKLTVILRLPLAKGN